MTMLIINNKVKIFDIVDNDTKIISPLPNDFNNMIVGEYYPVGNYVYKFIGSVDKLIDIPKGTIAVTNGRYFINDHDDDGKYRYSVNTIFDRNDSDESFEDIVGDYESSYDEGHNVMKVIKNKLVNSGAVYKPEFNDSDDALQRIIKQMIHYKNIILSDYKENFDKDYILDNLRSSLDGNTTHMTTKKFILWCDKVLYCDWRFSVYDDGINVENPLNCELVTTNDYLLELDDDLVSKCNEDIKLDKSDDPLKRLIKCAIIKKNICLKDYKSKGSTGHLLNNMRSTLRNKTRMSIIYFMNWCEILDLIYNLSIIDRETNTMFSSIMQ